MELLLTFAGDKLAPWHQMVIRRRTERRQLEREHTYLCASIGERHGSDAAYPSYLHFLTKKINNLHV